MLRTRVAALTAIILAAALSRLIPHPPNMTSVTAVALFGGAYFPDRRVAVFLALAGLFFRGLRFGLFPHFGNGLLGFFFFGGLGFLVQKKPVARYTVGGPV